MNVAVTCTSALMESVQDPVPEHAPCQPEKLQLELGTASSRTVRFASRDCWQSALHEKAGLEDCTWPLPAMWTVSVCWTPPSEPLPLGFVPPQPKSTMPATTTRTHVRMASPRQ